MCPPKKPAIKKPVPQAHVKQKQAAKLKIAKILKDEPLPGIVSEEEPPPKVDNWLDHLPPVIKPDAELHKQLWGQKKEDKTKKLYNFCMDQVQAMLNYSLVLLDLAQSESARSKLNKDDPLTQLAKKQISTDSESQKLETSPS